MAGTIHELQLAWRLARRELRGGVRGFRVFLACLALGVGAVAGVGSVSESLLAGIRGDARLLLGGDVDLRFTHRPASAEQSDWLAANTRRLSEIVQMRSMARRLDGEARSLIELKAVDAAYPLFGRLVLENGQPLGTALARRNGAFGAAVKPRLLDRLGLSIGDRVQVGEAIFVLTARILREPDRGAGAFTLGPRLLISRDALGETDLLRPGSLVRFHYRAETPPGMTPANWVSKLNERFPAAGWRVRTIDNAAPGIQRFVDRATLFLTLVGLTALLVGGVGIANAVRGHMESRRTTIATLKCLGGTGALIFRIYLIQVLMLATLGIAAGVLLGAVIPAGVAPLLAERLPIAARVDLYPRPLLAAVGFGYLITLAFALWPLGQARDVPAAGLFRAAVAPLRGRPHGAYLVAIAGAALLLAGLIVGTAHMPKFAIWFVAGAITTLAAFHGAARLLTRILRRAPRTKRPTLRLALGSLARPGAATGSVVLSLGVALTVLVAVVSIEANLTRQIDSTMPATAPDFYFIDIQGDQIADFRKLLEATPGFREGDSVPMLRGRIIRLGNTPVNEIKPPPEFAWILRGDRGLTWARTPPTEGSRIAAGEWWPADYAGPPLVSFDARAAAAFGLAVGDSITINLLGREVTARIANLREIDWTRLSINFVMIFSPGLLERAPQTYIATAKTDADAANRIERAVTDRFPNVSAVRVREVLDGVREILGRLGAAVRAVAALAVAAGALVLAGAIAAGHRRRVYDAVLLKVLGATRWRLLQAHLLEFGLLGLVTAVLAAVIGTIAGWAVVVHVMHADWWFDPAAIAATSLLCLAITILFGFFGTWRALGQKAAPVLRND
jgi:putative ABC transport system permease protein